MVTDAEAEVISAAIAVRLMKDFLNFINTQL
jgi:hypothetical protein